MREARRRPLRRVPPQTPRARTPRAPRARLVHRACACRRLCTCARARVWHEAAADGRPIVGSSSVYAQPQCEVFCPKIKTLGGHRRADPATRMGGRLSARPRGVAARHSRGRRAGHRRAGAQTRRGGTHGHGTTPRERTHLGEAGGGGDDGGRTVLHQPTTCGARARGRRSLQRLHRARLRAERGLDPRARERRKAVCGIRCGSRAAQSRLRPSAVVLLTVPHLRPLPPSLPLPALALMMRVTPWRRSTPSVFTTMIFEENMFSSWECRLFRAPFYLTEGEGTCREAPISGDPRRAASPPQGRAAAGICAHPPCGCCSAAAPPRAHARRAGLCWNLYPFLYLGPPTDVAAGRVVHLCVCTLRVRFCRRCAIARGGMPSARSAVAQKGPRCWCVAW